MPQQNNNGRTGAGSLLWAAAALLAVLVLATGWLLASILSGLTTADRNVIALSPTAPLQGAIANVVYERVPLEPDLATEDEQAAWQTETSVDLFKEAYANDEGVITVKSADGRKLIAPGTSNTYTFSLKNTGNVELSYSLSMRGVLQVNNSAIPLEVRLSHGDQWMLGGEDEWSVPAELDEVVAEGTVAVGESADYALEWRWPYEAGTDDTIAVNDLRDVTVASQAAVQNTSFALNITTYAEPAPGAVAVDENGNELFQSKVPLASIIVSGLIAAAAAAGLVLVILLMYRGLGLALAVPSALGVAEGSIGRKRSRIEEGALRFAGIQPGAHVAQLRGPGGAAVMSVSFRLERASNLEEGVRLTQGPSGALVECAKGVRSVELAIDMSGAIVSASEGGGHG